MTITKSNRSIFQLTYSALFLALALVLPFLTGQVPQIGAMLCPMHIPVLLCGFTCGWAPGLIVGFIAPLLRSLIFGTPFMYPVAVSMAFELACYGAVSGLLYRAFPKKNIYIYVSLIISMIAGRIVAGIANVILYGIKGNEYTFEAFISASIIKAVPGIILHIVLIPVLVIVLKKAKLIINTKL